MSYRYRPRRPGFSFLVAALGLVGCNVVLAAVLSPGALQVLGGGGIGLWPGRISTETTLVFLVITVAEVLFMYEF